MYSHTRTLGGDVPSDVLCHQTHVARGHVTTKLTSSLWIKNIHTAVAVNPDPVLCPDIPQITQYTQTAYITTFKPPIKIDF